MDAVLKPEHGAREMHSRAQKLPQPMWAIYVGGGGGGAVVGALANGTQETRQSKELPSRRGKYIGLTTCGQYKGLTT